jgi:hypothetical protein
VYVVNARMQIRGCVIARDVYPLAGFFDSLSSVNHRVMSKDAHVY